MSDMISRDESSMSQVKIKTSFAKIIVEGTAEKPYYSILYFDPDRGEYINGYGSYSIGIVFGYLAEYFEVIPGVDAEPVRHGRWIAQDDTFTRFRCSVCELKNYDGYGNYCPNCGANMDLEECDLGDLISREAALEKIGEAFRATDPKGEEQFGILKCSRMVREMPAVDAVEVVRCRDCKHRGNGYACPRYFIHMHCDDDDYTIDDGFCECGEKKGEIK